jgi:hypothetical protein
MAKLVINRESGECKGTGFIRFVDGGVTKDVVNKSAQLEYLHK